MLTIFVMPYHQGHEQKPEQGKAAARRKRAEAPANSDTSNPRHHPETKKNPPDDQNT